MLACQREKFSIDHGITYLNTAYMSPLLKETEEVGIQSLRRKSKPWTITPTDFFHDVEQLKTLFARLIQAPDAGRIALIPSVSYAVATIAKNIALHKGDQILILGNTFPSNYYALSRLARERGAELTIVESPLQNEKKGAKWNHQLLQAINPATRLVSIEHCHWVDGTRFDLEAIIRRAREVGAAVILDATQSIGAYPFDLVRYPVDAVFAAGYKWMFGAYGLGMAYYGPRWDAGIPIEENWINKPGSDIFENLLDYPSEDKPLAFKYNMGEQSQFIAVPMLVHSLSQLMEWGVESIQDYAQSILNPLLPILEQKGIWIEAPEYRSNHLFGLVPTSPLTDAIKKRLWDQKIYVSYRADRIRVSTHVYNTTDDLYRLIECISG
jgi:selenocysteine lyase/cysteine desulfurase